MERPPDHLKKISGIIHAPPALCVLCYPVLPGTVFSLRSTEDLVAGSRFQLRRWEWKNREGETRFPGNDSIAKRPAVTDHSVTEIAARVTVCLSRIFFAGDRDTLETESPLSSFLDCLIGTLFLVKLASRQGFFCIIR